MLGYIVTHTVLLLNGNRRDTRTEIFKTPKPGNVPQWRTEGGWGVQTPTPKFRRPSKIVPNSTRLWKLLKIA